MIDLGTPRQRFILNVISNVTYIGSYALASMWLTPFLIGHLGLAAFGIVLLVTNLTAYMEILKSAIEASVSRFLSIHLESGDSSAANKTFNTALFGIAGIFLLLVPGVIYISLNFSTLFDVPPGLETGVSILFAAVSLAFFTTMSGGIFAISPFIKSRFFLSNLVNFFGLAARLGTLAILFSFFGDQLVFVGWGVLAGAGVSLLGFIVLWRKLTPELHLSVSDLDRTQLRLLSGMGGWMTVNTIGATLLDRVDLIVVNAYFGATMTGGYGTVVQFSLLMEYLVTAVSSVIRPVLLIKYAHRDFSGLRVIAFQSVKLLGFGLALPVGLLCGFSKTLLTVWLGPAYTYLAPVLVLVVCHQSLNLSVRPLLHVQNTYNKVRWPAIVILFVGVANLGLAILVARWGKWGVSGIAIVGGLLWIAKNAFFVPIYTAHILEQPWWSYLPCLLSSVISTAIVSASAYGLSILYPPENWFSLGLSAALISLVYLALVWMTGMNTGDRQLLKDLFPLKRAGGRPISVQA